MIVTGGSSTAGNTSWPSRLADMLSKQLNISNIDLRNAAMGSTSQLVTSPCIQTLVGPEVDVLFWEFGMNDEPKVWHPKGPSVSLRQRMAEVYIRQAIDLNPLAIGFVHFGDLKIHDWQGSIHDLPDWFFHPTSNVMR
jgi:hypothetical protein